MNLEGQHVLLRPIELADLAGLEENFSEELTQFYPRQFSSAQEYYENVILQDCFGKAQVFTIIDKKTGKPVGCTGFFYADPNHRRVEIGGTWVGRSFQGTAINSEAKFLLLNYAFGDLKCIRVAFTTDLLNLKSQAALEKLGAVREGILRNHLVVHGGRIRDSVYYSILDSEWPAVAEKIKARIRAKA